jgi:hypothetical protein
MPIFVFKEIKACDFEVFHSTPKSHMCTVKRPLMELLWIFLSSTATILFVDTDR